ncbi:MAG: SRPBCC family protein [Chloroflexota bacterium]|nr:SRPBCC family protein [Chloroflexota bacterium]
MKSVIGIRIAAPRERIFDLAVDVERWPERLPHYRYVRRVDAAGRERRFAMGARRGWIPVRWEAVQRPIPERGEIEFEHVGGVTRGMHVRWRLAPAGGAVDVSIEHRLRLAWPLIGELIAHRVIGRHFVEPIADRTLRRIKQLAERPA